MSLKTASTYELIREIQSRGNFTELIVEIEKSKMILQRAVSTDPNFGEMQRTAYTKYCTEVDTYNEILSSATILSADKLEDGLNIDTIYHPIKTII